MNFLSHFYFDRFSNDPNLVIGTVLPDLVRNADKRVQLHPHRFEEQINQLAQVNRIYDGWKRHLEVDRHFHSSAFFTARTRQLRLCIADIVNPERIRPSFVAHIGIELMLDSLLITEGLINPTDFYAQIGQADHYAIDLFLTTNKVSNTEPFFHFLREFIRSAYLNSYRDANNIVYAITRICQRLWPDPLNETQKLQLASIILDYTENLRPEFIGIFDEIDRKLNAGATL